MQVWFCGSCDVILCRVCQRHFAGLSAGVLALGYILRGCLLHLLTQLITEVIHRVSPSPCVI